MDIPPPSPKYRVRFKELSLLKLREALLKETGSMAVAWLEGKIIEECISRLTEKLQNISDDNTKERKVRRKADRICS